VVAAGSASRFGVMKQFVVLAGRAVLSWSVEVAASVCDGVVLVLPADTSPPPDCPPVDFVVAGGSTRSQSVRAGLSVVPREAEFVVVHDAARPLAGATLWQEVLEVLRRKGADAAVPVSPPSDTIKAVRADGSLHTLDRSTLVAVQTPQAFKASSLRAAHSEGPEATDDAALIEAAGGRVEMVQWSEPNPKLTRPEDLVVMETLIGLRAGSPTLRAERS